MKHLICVITAFALLSQQTLTVWAQSLAAGTEDPVDSFVLELRGTINPNYLDRTALLDSLDYDAEKIVNFVTSNVRYEQYPGALRGTEITFLSRAGNALDQSILLASMLKDAGYEARVHRTEIPRSNAESLLEDLGKSVSPDDAQFYDAGIENILDRHSDTVGQSLIQDDDQVPAPDQKYRSRTEELRHFLEQTLQDAGIKIGNSDSATLSTEARDYYWVEYKTSAADPWTAAHPAGLKGLATEPLIARETFADSIPDDLQHRIRIQFFIEQKVGGQIKERPLAAAWERPAANLARTPFTFYVASTALNSQIEAADERMRSLEPPTKGNDILVLDFNGTPLSNAFDMNGNIIPLAEAGSMYAGVFATVSDKLNLGGAALSNLGAADDQPADDRLTTLHAVKVVFTFIAPDGDEDSEVRYIFDAATSPNMTQLDIYRQLTRKYSMMVETGWLTEAYVIENYLNNYKSKMEATETTLSFLAKQSSSKLKENLAVGWAAHIPMFALLQNAPVDYSYVSEPSLVIHHQSLPFDATVFEGIDIVHSVTRSFAREGDRLVLDAKSNVTRGIWETVIESAALHPAGDGQVVDTYSIFSHHIRSGTEFLTIASDSDERLDSLGIDPILSRSINSDLRKGHIVIIPKNLSKQESQIAWWSLNSKEGSILGKNRYGEGATATEYQIMLTAVAALSLGAFATGSCLMNAPPGSDAGAAIGCLLCGFLAAATGAIAVYLVLSPSGAMFAGTAVEAATVAKYYKAFVIIMGPWAAKICGQKVLNK